MLSPAEHGQLVEVEPVRFAARYARVRAFTPKVWDAPDGRQVRTELVRYARDTGSLRRPFSFDTEFVMHFEHEGRPTSLHCSTKARTVGEPPPRLACWSTDEEGSTSFFQIPAEPDPVCTEPLLREAGHHQELAHCWQGRLSTSTARYDIQYPVLARNTVVVHELVWRDSSGRVAQTSHAHEDWTDAYVSVRRGEADVEDHSVLLLNALAVHAWADMLHGGRWNQGEAEARSWP